MTEKDFHLSALLDLIEPTWGQIEPDIAKLSKILIWVDGTLGGSLFLVTDIVLKLN